MKYLSPLTTGRRRGFLFRRVTHARASVRDARVCDCVRGRPVRINHAIRP